MLDRELRYRRLNATLADFNGVAVEAALGRSVAEVLPQAYPQLAPMLARVLQGEALLSFRVQAEVPRLQGAPSEWEASYIPLRESPTTEVVGVLVQAVNVTAQESSNRALKESAGQLRRVLDSLFAFVGVLDTEGILLEANRAPLLAAGIGSEDVIGRPFWDTFWWNHDPAVQDWMRTAIALAREGRVTRQDVVARMAGDSRMVIDFMLAPLRNASGEITHLIPSGIDVSARVASEQALRDSEARFRSSFESSPEGMALVEPPGHFVLVNPSLCRIFGHAPEDLLGQSVHRLLLDEDRAAHQGFVTAFLAHPTLRQMAPRRHVRGLRADGAVVSLEIGLTPLAGGTPPQVLITVSDISERLRHQAQIENALKEKTVLLNEVHHRVKNNLQIIASMLRLQSKHVDEPSRAVLRDSRNRVKAMALTHQLLYERGDFAGLELGVYLSRLASLLRETYGELGHSVQVRVLAPSTGLRIDIQQGVPCALLVSELVTNAFKHAFPDGRPGEILVQAERIGEGTVRLEISDDGVGLPPEIELGQGGSLGLQLVPLLAGQLGGQASIDRQSGAGTRFLIDIPLDESTAV